MSTTHDLQHSIKLLCKTQRIGSYTTRACRDQGLSLFAKDLVKLGYKLRHIRGLKAKHIIAVVKKWQAQGLGVGTLKNRLSYLRHIAKLLGRDIVPSNECLGIGKRSYLPTKNKALMDPDFSGITDDYVRLSLELQQAFGLRREEAMKIKPWKADQGDCIILQPSWCKGKRARTIPITTPEQRAILDKAKAFVKESDASLIPADLSYKQQRNRYQNQLKKANLRNVHGLRHAYAQRRYLTLTGWQAPIAGGPRKKELTKAQRRIDMKARLQISEELGHSREQVTATYLSR